MNEENHLGRLVSELAKTHAELWHEEDSARVSDDLQVARAKRKIDQLNQKRNDLIEEIDQCVAGMLNDKKKKKDFGLKGRSVRG